MVSLYHDYTWYDTRIQTVSKQRPNTGNGGLNSGSGGLNSGSGGLNTGFGGLNF